MSAKFRKFFGFDFHVVATLILRGWGVLAGGFTILILPHYLNPVEQGYYFTFGSILALQIFFELGLNQILIQLVAHEVANLTPAGDGYVGKNFHISRLKSIAHLANRWYQASAIIFVIIAVIFGVLFFSYRNPSSVSLWLGVWIVLVLTSALNLWLSPRLALYEGCGRVGQIAWVRFTQSVLGYLLLWVALYYGAGLWAVVCLPAVNFLFTSFWLKRYGNLLHWISKLDQEKNLSINWKIEVLPLQWRIAISWISGYLIFNLFVPLIFTRDGAVEAGRLGIALALFSAMSTIGMSWVTSKAPTFTTLIAQRKWRELNELFKAVFFRSTFSLIIMTSIFISTIYIFERFGSSIPSRIASFEVLVVLAILTISNGMVFAMAVYLRSYRKEPMLIQSVVIGLMVSGTIYITSEYGMFYMMLSYMVICVFISLPWTALLFFNFKKENLNFR